jgi:hypothetical protein
MIPAESRNTARHPAISATKLAKGRDSMMPVSSPLITRPIVRP